jgi:hypothetical protein
VYAPYNWDIVNSGLRDTLLEVMRSKKVVIGRTLNLVDGNNAASVLDAANTADWIKGVIGEEEDATGPLTAFYYPIIENSEDSVIIGEDSNLVGVLAETLFWRDLMGYILPKGSNGVVVVFGNACNQSFTFQINGPSAVYLGPSDLHDSEYDYLEVRVLTAIEITNVPYLFAESCSHHTLFISLHSARRDSWILKHFPSEQPHTQVYH